MNKIINNIQDYLHDFRFGFTLICILVLGLLLLFYLDLSVKLKEIFIPSLVVFTIGTGLIAKIQILLKVSENTKKIASNKRPRGIKECHLNKIISVYILWFIGFVVYNACKM